MDLDLALFWGFISEESDLQAFKSEPYRKIDIPAAIPFGGRRPPAPLFLDIDPRPAIDSFGDGGY